MKKKSSKPLAFKMWGYFAAFAAMLMIVLWLLQIIFLNAFYKSMKIHQLERVGEEFLENYDSENIEDYIDSSSFQYGVRINIIDKYGDILNGHDKPERTGFDGEHRPRIHVHFDELGKAVIEDNGFSPMRAASYFAEIPNEDGMYLYITAPLAQIDATTQVLQNQLIIVTVLSLVIAILLSYFISKKLSKPISGITKSAKVLGNGDYNVHFEKGYYREVDELAEALNSTAEALSKTDELRRDLMANVSHDLRTPLTIIKSYAEMIRDLSGRDEVKRTAHANVIVDEADRLSLLVNDILDLSKMESGASGIENKPFNLREALDAVMAIFKPFEDDGYVFNLDCCDTAVVCGDFQRIKSVMYNLVVNAVNYTGGDKQIYICLAKKDGKVCFSVRDTGNGIEEEDIPRVWERYYRASAAHKRDVVGTGIGLSIVKTVLKAHKAEFGVNSKVGEGSTFWFNLKSFD